MPPKKRRNNNQRSTTSVPLTAASEEDDEINEEDYFTDDDEEDQNQQRKLRSSAAASSSPQKRHTPRKFEAPENIRLVWEHTDLEYDENEDLLNIQIPPKPIDSGSSGKTEYRLMIHQIVVENFKSYRGTQTLGPFHKNLTMIMGPNGSGKSNVIDSLLFVFGFRSNKIRSKKLSSLIHTAAALGGERCKFCRVEIQMYFVRDLDDDRYEIKPNSNFAISRQVFLDNSSKYLINGKTASHKDVEEYLKNIGIDLIHNRFLILQGEVEAIAMMKPRATQNGEEGMLEYIEDIVGSNRFVPFIRKLEHRVRQIEIQTNQQGLYVREAEKLKKELEPQVKNAQRFMNSQNEVAFLKSKLIQIEKYRLTQEKIPIEVEIKEKEAEIHEMEKKKRNLILEIREVEATDADNNLDQEKVQDEIETYNTEIREVETAESKRKSNLKKCNNELVRMTKELDTETKKKIELEAMPEIAKRRIEMLESESRDLLEQEAKDTKTANENLVKFEKKVVDERAKKEAAEEEYSSKNAIFNELKTKTTVFESDILDIRKCAQRDQELLEELKIQLEGLHKKLEDDKKEFADIKRALPQIQRTWRDAQVEFPHIQNQEANLRNKLDVLRAKFNEDSRDNELLTKGSTVHIALLEAKASGRLPGLLGRLGDLGAIDPLYDAAISTTCPHLDWYVVETANDGQAAIDYLIECSLPRCSFMCLDQTLNAEASMNRNKKDFPAPRLFDLLRIQEPRIRKVFYQSVGDMLVVPGLLEAQRIDRQFHGKYRIVTYEGNTIERTGAVSGGGKAITGRIGSDIRAPQSEKQQEEFRQTKAQLDQTTEEHAEIYARYQFLEVQLADISKKANGMIAARDRLQNSFADQTTNIETKKRAVEAQENKVALAKFDPKEMEEKEKKLEEMKKELQEAEAEAKAVKIKVTKCSSKIDGMFNELVAKYRARAALAKERYMNVEEEIAKENAAIINSQHNVAAMERLLVELRDTLMKKRIECDALGSAEADGKEVFALNDLVRNRRQKLSLLRDAAQELRKRRQELDEEERNQNRNLTDLRDSLTSLNQSLDDIELQLEGFQRQIAALKIRKIPDFSKYENVRIDHDIGWIEEDQDEDQEEDSERRRRMKRENEETQRNVVTFEDVEEFTMMTDMEIEDMTRAEKEKIRQNLKSLEKYMETNRENTDESIFDEYIKKAKIYLAHVEKLDKFGVNLQIHRKKLGELRQFRYSEFADALAFLGATTQALYQLITNGGDASLKFVEEGRTADPFEAGVKFSVRPAKKSWKLIENLSGGEKTLASLCFVFAMHHYRSTPLYVMDEIDAALDSQNVRLIANYIRNSERTKNAQFIIISLRNQMFEVGNRLIGVYKVNDCTHHVVLAPKQLKNTVQEVTQKLMEKLKLHRKAAEAPEASASTKQFFLQPTVFLAPKTPVATTPRRRTIIAPRIEDLEPVVMTSSTNGIKQKQVVEVVFENDFDFEEDEAPVKKRRRRTVCDDDDDEEEEEDQEEEFAEVATTSNAATNSPTTSRRATRSTCK